ncbi:MAG: TIGR04255 family protein [SAR324 cluster bacterium]|nr:TIGR04255 family protein [SAR324 cluster bacterium]
MAFSKLEKLTVPYIGLLWEEYRKEYPESQEVSRLIDPPQGQIEHPEEFFIPRVWFVNTDETRVIQIQNDRFFYNWRKRKQAYPNFDRVFPEFDDHFKKFRSFIQDHNLGNLELKNFELTYINYIPVGSGWTTLAEISHLFPDIAWKNKSGRFLPEPENLNAHLSFLLPEGNGSLVATIQKGRRLPDNVEILILQLRAKGFPVHDESQDFQKWFDLAHEWIVLGFEDLTSKEVQKEFWGKK